MIIRGVFFGFVFPETRNPIKCASDAQPKGLNTLTILKMREKTFDMGSQVSWKQKPKQTEMRRPKSQSMSFKTLTE